MHLAHWFLHFSAPQKVKKAGFKTVAMMIVFVPTLMVPAVMASEVLLRDFFRDVQSLKANFTQLVEDDNGSVLDRASGKFYLSRPGRFRWDYKNQSFDGELGQQIVADGKSLFFYDPDLEQVSKRSLDDALAQVPSLVLVQEGEGVDEHFTITEFGLTDGLSWVSLAPKDEDAAYQKLMVGFNEGVISSLMLYDGLGNSTQLQLSNVVINSELAANAFEFEIPEGADVLSEP